MNRVPVFCSVYYLLLSPKKKSTLRFADLCDNERDVFLLIARSICQ